MPKSSPCHISIWAWLWLPLGFLVFQIGGEFLMPRPIWKDMHSENGFHEIAQFIIMAATFLVALSALIRYVLLGWSFMVVWFLIAVLGSFYVAGEEISWGQHFFGWTSGEFWREINDQGETNLHNTSSWLDQKPRLILELAVIVGGIILPLLKRWKSSVIPSFIKEITPPLHFIPLALMVAFLKLSEDIFEVAGIVFYIRGSEVVELFVFYYVFLYVLNHRLQVARHNL